MSKIDLNVDYLSEEYEEDYETLQPIPKRKPKTAQELAKTLTDKNNWIKKGRHRGEQKGGWR
ncbi:MAG: hypothetical protein NWF07_13835 [Candidatus Bathyarchaeota archaeon]|nr:hypothetical protein [Candidatus Bathyarchaeota archaeon]